MIMHISIAIQLYEVEISSCILRENMESKCY